MRGDLVKKSLVLGAAIILVSIAIAPLINSSILQTTHQYLDNGDKNAVMNLNMRKVIVVPDDYPTIQEAIDHANDGDQIKVREGIYYENIVVDKMVTITGEGFKRTIIDGGENDHTVSIVRDGVEISFFTIRNSGAGDAGFLIDSHYNTVSMNKITENGYGVKLDSSNGNKIVDNWIVENQGRGVWLYASHMNDISGNDVSGNGDGRSNEGSGNGDGGFLVDFTSTYNNLSGNIVADNSGNGLVVDAASRSNTVVGNKLSVNAVGVKGMGASDSNIFHHNDFSYNDESANDSSTNTWNSLDQGNHWSDFDEPGEGAYDNDSNGIVDAPYDIPGGDNQDFYPLVVPPIPNPPVIEGPSEVKNGDEACYNINTPDPIYDEVYYQLYWDNGGYWETTAEVNTTVGTEECHTWNLPSGVTNKTYYVLARAFIEIEGFKLYSECSPPLPVNVPKNMNMVCKQTSNVLSLEKMDLNRKETKTGTTGMNTFGTINAPLDCDWIVDAGGNGDFENIQPAIDAASPGDTICVWAGSYVENIDVHKPLTIIGNGSANTVIKGVSLSNRVVTIDTNDVVIQGFRIINGDLAGIWMEKTSGCVIQENILESNSRGFLVFYSQDATISNNGFTDCGLGIYGNTLQHFLHTIENNMVNGLELFYAKNVDTVNIGDEEDYGSIILANCSNVVIDGQNHLSDGEMGVEIAFCTDVVVKNSNLSGNAFGAYVYNCTDNVFIQDNTVFDNINGMFLKKSSIAIGNNDICENEEYGIQLWGSSGSHIEGNEVCNNSIAGIYLQNSHDNTIGDDNMVRDNVDGIDLYSSSHNTIVNNTILRNTYNGLFLKNASVNYIGRNLIERNGLNPDGQKNGIELKEGSSNNIIHYNIIRFSEYYGLYIHDNSDGNLIYHNVFWYNGHQWLFIFKQACDSCSNTYDNGYPEPYIPDWKFDYDVDEECGNYWSDHLCTDTKAGPNQDEWYEDDICDSPYPIPCGSNIDRYPLQKLPGSGPIEDSTPPELSIHLPLPGMLYILGKPIQFPFLKIPIIIDLFGTFTLLEADAYEDPNVEWQSNFVEVKFKLTQDLPPFRTFEKEDLNPPYTWRLSEIDATLYGKYLLSVNATDAAGNYATVDVVLRIFPFKLYNPWIPAFK